MVVHISCAQLCVSMGMRHLQQYYNIIERIRSKETYQIKDLPTAPPRESKPANILCREIPKVDDGGGSDAVVTAMQHAAAAAEVIVMPFILLFLLVYTILSCQTSLQ